MRTHSKKIVCKSVINMVEQLVGRLEAQMNASMSVDSRLERQASLSMKRQERTTPDRFVC